ncbi:MAG: ATP-binding protein, partial [Beijerinckiaceae bacterium]
MNMPLPAAQFTATATPDRRQDEQPAHRVIGKVVAIDGARATIATSVRSAEHASLDFWSIGRLITINLHQSRIVAMVYQMTVQHGLWEEGKDNVLLVQVELVGEVVDQPNGTRQFRRGIANYPWLGAMAHRIRSEDLRSVFDLGSRKGIEIGRISQDESIPAVVSMEDMLSKHFSVVGTTGVGKSSAVSLLVRKAVEAKPDLRALVLDPHNEYSHAFRDISVTLDVNTLDLPHWLFKFDELLDVIYRGRTAPESEADILRELVPLAKSQFSVAQSAMGAGSLLKKSTEGLSFTPDSPAPYRMLDLLALLDEMMGKLDPRHDRYHLRVLKGRLESLCTDPRYRFMFGRGATEDNIEFVLGKL